MAMPPGFAGNLLVTERTKTLLGLPEVEQLSFAPEVIHGFSIQSLFKVGFPLGVVGIGLGFDFGMTGDGGLAGIDEADLMFLSVLVNCLTEELPMSSFLVWWAKVFLFNPGGGFVAVASFRPAPEFVPNQVVDFAEGLFADHVPVIIRPTLDNGVKLGNQLTGRGSLMGFNNLSNFGQQGFDLLLGRFNQQLPLVFADILSQEVEPIFDVRDGCFLWGEG
jgi:hypothetical protein